MFFQNSEKFVTVSLKITIYMYLPFIDKTSISLSLSEIVTLNLATYILTILTCPLKVRH